MALFLVKLVSDIALCLWLSPLVPLLSIRSTRLGSSHRNLTNFETHLVSQQTLLVFLRSGIPTLHILVRAFPVLQRQEVEKDGRVPSFRVHVASCERPEDEELLRRRVRDGGQYDGTQRDPKVQLDPVRMANTAQQKPYPIATDH